MVVVVLSWPPSADALFLSDQSKWPLDVYFPVFISPDLRRFDFGAPSYIVSFHSNREYPQTQTGHDPDRCHVTPYKVFDPLVAQVGRILETEPFDEYNKQTHNSEQKGTARGAGVLPSQTNVYYSTGESEN